MKKTNVASVAVACLLVLSFIGVLIPGQASALLITYDNRGTFTTDNPGLQVEDFEDALVPPGGIVGYTGPLNSASDNGVFSPGDILDGITFQDNPGPDGSGMVALGSGFFGGSSTTIASNVFADSLDVHLGPGVTAFGLDVFTTVATPVTFSVFGTNGLLGSFDVNATSAAPTFFGVFSNADLITRVNINSKSGTVGEAIDNVAFGNPVPEPSTVLLLGAGLIGLVGLGRKKAKS